VNLKAIFMAFRNLYAELSQSLWLFAKRTGNKRKVERNIVTNNQRFEFGRLCQGRMLR
jgi:hypothetical protein